jgi:saccharopine dehydrogenase-like NADP-dependent oxidoreductase
MRTRCSGEKDGRPATLTFDLIDHYDPHTGFTSMERMTGFPASIMIAHGRLEPGARPMEVAMPTGEFMAGLAARGFQIGQRLKME